MFLFYFVTCLQKGKNPCKTETKCSFEAMEGEIALNEIMLFPSASWELAFTVVHETEWQLAFSAN